MSNVDGRGRGAPDRVEPLPVKNRLVSPAAAPIERLQLTVVRRLDGLLAGDHAGLFPGHGTERGEARPYVPGDDPRHIDWAVTARTHDPHVRDTISDHELELWLVLDTSSSQAFGTGRSTKHELGWTAAGAFALLACRGGNRIGAVTSGAGGRMVPARSGRAHVAALLTAVRPEPEDGDKGDLAGAIKTVRNSAKRRGMVIVVSDFLGAPDWERGMRALTSRHDVIAVQVSDLRESELPDVGLISVVDPESGRRRLVDTSDREVRTRYAGLATRKQEQLTARLKSIGADHVVLRTDRDWVLDIVRFVGQRRNRRTASAGARHAASPAARPVVRTRP